MIAVGFKIAVSNAKSMFFDREAVIRAVDRRMRRYLGHVGGYIAKTARNSLQKRKAVPLKQMTKAEQARFEPFRKPDTRRIDYRAAAAAGVHRRFLRTTSRPGQPPVNQTGLLKRLIFYSYEPSNRSVVIGPAKLNRGTDAPHVLEHGGTATIRSNGVERRVQMAARPFMQPALEAGTRPGRTAAFWAEATRGG